MSLPTLDFEVYSEAGYVWDSARNKWRGVTKTQSGIAAVGAAVYSEHPSTTVLCLAYNLLDGIGPRLWLPGMDPPVALFNHIRRGGLLEAHNSGFEWLIWYNVCHRRMGWPPLPLHQLRCSVAKSRAFSLPGKLGEVAKVLNASEQKDPRGEALIRKLCVPRNPTKADLSTRCTDPELLAELYCYCLQDVRAESAVSEMVPDLRPDEQELWLLDQRINLRGVAIDREALDNCISIVEQATEKYTQELRQITGGAVQTAGELSKIIGWLGANGVHTGTLDADRVEELLGRDGLPPAARRVLEIRASLGAASVKKLFAIERRLTADGRLHDLFAFCGADRTGRWAGRGPQPQNLPGSGPKVCCGQPIEWGIEAVERALIDISTRSLSCVESVWGDAVAVVSGCLRGLFSAAPGYDLICSDYSAIEAVVLAELAGEEWRQEVFRTHGKIYEMSASKISGIPFEEFARHKAETGQHHPLRKKVGKVAELASGYGGGLGAWKAFGADEFMTDEEIQINVKAWRLASPAIARQRDDRTGQPPGFWYGLQEAATMAITCLGYKYSFRAISYWVSEDVLYCGLPSGRTLTYHSPRLESKTMPWGAVTQCITYMGWNSNYQNGPIGWMRLETYGPKLTENVVQAVSRDLLAYGMKGLDAAGYGIVLHVHDEVVVEVPEGWGSIEEVERIMSTTPAWAEGWPVRAAGGWRGKRYRKG